MAILISGCGPVQVREYPIVVAHPVCLPDGLVAYNYYDTDDDISPAGVGVLDTATGRSWVVPETQGIFALLQGCSEDGVFLWAILRGYPELIRLAVASGEQQVLSRDWQWGPTVDVAAPKGSVRVYLSRPSPDGQWLAGLCAHKLTDGRIMGELSVVTRRASGGELLTLCRVRAEGTPYTSIGPDVAWSWDSKLVAFVGAGGRIGYTSLAGDAVTWLAGAHGSHPAFLGEDCIAWIGEDGQIRVHELASGRTVDTGVHGLSVTGSLSGSKDGDMLAYIAGSVDTPRLGTITGLRTALSEER